jgi:protein-S-isoprenylcysteine O-methyltransferase Ste14
MNMKVEGGNDTLERSASTMVRLSILVYGLVSYLIFLVSFLYAVGFVGGFAVPKTIDSGAGEQATAAILIDLAFLSLFAIQHSVMARPVFKQWLTRVIPAAAERSTFVLASGFALILLFWFWQPLPDRVWHVSNSFAAGMIWIVFWSGWLIVLISTFLINHFDLFGLRQVFLFFLRQPYTAVPFRRLLFYRVVRHPIMLGFLIAFWATPTMTKGHLLFAAVVTVYVLIALQLEEHDLLQSHGESYSAYRDEVRMLLPIPKRGRADSA